MLTINRKFMCSFSERSTVIGPMSHLITSPCLKCAVASAKNTQFGCNTLVLLNGSLTFGLQP